VASIYIRPVFLNRRQKTLFGHVPPVGYLNERNVGCLKNVAFFLIPDTVRPLQWYDKIFNILSNSISIPLALSLWRPPQVMVLVVLYSLVL
jgi:hypothetical protein